MIELDSAEAGSPERAGGPAPDPRPEARWRRIEAKLEAAAYWLMHQGGLARTTTDGRSAWVVRYVRRGTGDRPAHASIFICRGDCPELLERVRARLAALRSEGAWVGRLGALARLAGRVERSVRVPAGRRDGEGRPVR